MALEAGNTPGSSQRSGSKRVSKASKIKSAEIIEDSDEEEEPVATSNKTSREGAKFAPSNNFKASIPVESSLKRNKQAKIQDVSSTPNQRQLVQNGRLPKKPKLDISSSLDRPKASVQTKSPSMQNTAFQSKDVSSSPVQRSMEVNGKPSKKQELDISGSGSDPQESDSQNHQEESSDESEGETSRKGISDGNQSETSGSVERSNASGARPASKNSALPVQMPNPRRMASPYEPPSGFKSAPITLHPASEIAQTLSPSALQGKELWHITVPNSVPISSIAEISTKNILTGAAILTHYGAEYGLSLEIQDKTAQRIVLFPSSNTANYESAEINIAKTLHLQRKVRLPNSAAESDKPTQSISRKHIKGRNEQPPGLKMRYRPFGASSESSEQSDPEQIAKEPLSATRFQVPRSVIDPSSMKRKHDQTDQTDETQSPARVKRKMKPGSSDVLTELDRTLDQHMNQNKALDESPEVHASAELKADPLQSTTTLEKEPGDTPRSESFKTPKSHRHRHRKEINGATSLSNNNTPSKIANSPSRPLPVSNTQSPTKSRSPFSPKPSQTLTPSLQITTFRNTKALPDEEPQRPVTNSNEIQQHAGKDEIEAHQPSHKQGYELHGPPKVLQSLEKPKSQHHDHKEAINGATSLSNGNPSTKIATSISKPLSVPNTPSPTKPAKPSPSKPHDYYPPSLQNTTSQDPKPPTSESQHSTTSSHDAPQHNKSDKEVHHTPQISNSKSDDYSQSKSTSSPPKRTEPPETEEEKARREAEQKELDEIKAREEKIQRNAMRREKKLRKKERERKRRRLESDGVV